ncbi:MAG: cytochrome c5 family protein [Legionella sp.]|nr:cytochrome c5 family protein [Legionella sp.]
MKHDQNFQKIKTAFLLCFAALPFFCYAATSNTHQPQTFLEKIKGLPDEGQQIRDHFCTNCHGENPLIALGAPRVKVATDWDPRIKAGIALLLKHTREGFNAMPPRGGCFECSDEQLTQAILAMLSDDAKTGFLKALAIENENHIEK